jgi:hypothetical protein
MRTALLLLAALVVVGAILFLLLLGKSDDSMHTIVHVRNNPGVPQHRDPFPCPVGYHLVRKLFIEKDGSRQDAYVRDGALEAWRHEDRSNSVEFSVDYLLAGESVGFPLPIPGPTPAASEGERQKL